MPTPFYHLYLAEDILRHPGLPLALGHCSHKLLSAFLFGNIAPDVQVVSGQRREETHFFNLPIQKGDPKPWDHFLHMYPQFEDENSLSTQQAAFLAGYLCHLQADWIWVKDIFAPFFGLNCTWGTFEERLYLHNVLRAYLDVRILPELNQSLGAYLWQVEPDGWLPFVDDHTLTQWHDMVFSQLQPGSASQTVEVFCSRQGISIPEFMALLESEERMQQEVFTHLPSGVVQDYHQCTLEANLQLLIKYLRIPIREVVS